MITSSYPRHADDGAGSFVGSLARALAERGHDVCVLAPYDPAIAPIAQAPASAGAPTVRRFRYAPTRDLHIAGHGRALSADTRMKWLAPLLMPGYVVAAVAQALRWHRQQPFDVLHGHWAVPGGPIAALVGALTRTPVVLSLHGSDVFVIEHSALYRWAARWAFDRAFRTAACSENLRSRAVAAGLAYERSAVIPYGVDGAQFATADAAAVATLRARLGLPQNAPVIGALGRLVHKKGFSHLVAALPAVLRVLPNVRCVIGGSGDLQADLRAEADQLGLGDHLLLPGAIDWQTTPAFYALCDVLAVPSVVDAHGNVDGLPNVLLEGMACGRAIVASHVAGIPDVLRDDENGLLVPSAESSALATALIRLLGDAALRRRLGDAARRTVLASYRWPQIAEQYEAMYASACQAR